MRKDVKKVLFVGLPSDKESFFIAAQELGLIHFLDATKGGQKELPADLDQLTRALKILLSAPVLPQEDIHDFSRCDSIVEAILSSHDSLEQNMEEQRLLHLEMARVGPFGAFSPEDIAYIEATSGRYVRFYWAKEGLILEEELPVGVLRIANSHGLDYFVAFEKEPWHHSHIVAMVIPEPIQILREHLRHAHKEGHRLDQHLKGYARYSTFLHKALIDKLNSYHLYTAQNGVQMAAGGLLFAVEGWAPVNKLSSIYQLAHDRNIFCEEIAPDSGEVAPTYLENRGAARIGEDLVHIYDVPSNTDKDPSIWVLSFFALFFAMIMGDAGYGLILLGIALYLRLFRSSAIKNGGKRFWQLLVILATSCLLWGALTNNFFGIEFRPDSPVLKVSLLNWLVHKKVAYHASHHDATFLEWQQSYPLLNADDDPQTILMSASHVNREGVVIYKMLEKFSDNVLMELALVVGIFHITLSLLRYSRRSWSHIAWIFFILGSYLYLPYYLDATSFWQYLAGISAAAVAPIALKIIGASLAAVVVLSILQHGFRGAFHILEAPQVFSDVLSYLRLYALGVAGAIMGSTVNEMALMVGSVGGLFVLIFGHLFNLTLSMMGGIIHGLRLNFLEWYHYSFEGGGEPFRPLEKVRIE